MKPHEETTHYTPSGVKGGYLVHTESGDDAARVASGYEHMGPLWSAAPEMARMLLDLLKNYEPGEKVDGQLTTLLTKAGVLP